MTTSWWHCRESWDWTNRTDGRICEQNSMAIHFVANIIKEYTSPKFIFKDEYILKYYINRFIFHIRFIAPTRQIPCTCVNSVILVSKWHCNLWMCSGSCCGSVSPIIFPRKGESPKEGSVPLWWKQSRSSESCKPKEWKHNRVKRANPAFCSCCLHCEVCTR